jgi:Zn-dependent M28 family amino/carboxypeptidase
LFVISTVASATMDEDTSARKPVPESWKVGFDSITANDSYAYLEFIAADELEGRDTATPGLTIARKYIQSLYKTWNVEPAGDPKGDSHGFGQRIDMVEIGIGGGTRIEVQSDSNTFRYEWQADFSGGMGVELPGVLDAPAIFAGYGLSAPDLDYDDFAGIDVRNKIVVTSFGKPGGDREDSPFNFPENRARFAGRYTPAETCARLLASKGALALLIVDESVGRAENAGGYIRGSRIRSSRRPIVAPKLSAAVPRVPAFWISTDVADSLFAQSGKTFSAVKSQIDAQLKPQSMDLPQTSVKLHLDLRRTNTVSANVLGRIEGSDPELKDEVVVIGAHLDHVGMNEDGYVFNGADDNGSGSVGVLQVAKAVSRNPIKPKRTLLFAHWTGEEKGLVGSRFFVHYPTVELSKVVACLNMDMICRNTSLATLRAESGDFDIAEEELSKYPDEPEKLLVAYTSSPSPAIARYSVDIAREYLDLIVVPFSSFPMLGNSDHYPFAQKHVPSVFFNTQGHRDLHQPGDTVEKINAEKMSEIVKLVYLMAFTIADADQRPGWEESR